MVTVYHCMGLLLYLKSRSLIRFEFASVNEVPTRLEHPQSYGLVVDNTLHGTCIGQSTLNTMPFLSKTVMRQGHINKLCLRHKGSHVRPC